jgi:hypothetical protein
MLVTTYHTPATGIATHYVLHGSGVESQWKKNFSYLSTPTLKLTYSAVKWIQSLNKDKVPSPPGGGADPRSILAPRFRMGWWNTVPEQAPAEPTPCTHAAYSVKSGNGFGHKQESCWKLKECLWEQVSMLIKELTLWKIAGIGNFLDPREHPVFAFHTWSYTSSVLLLHSTNDCHGWSRIWPYGEKGHYWQMSSTINRV